MVCELGDERMRTDNKKKLNTVVNFLNHAYENVTGGLASKDLSPDEMIQTIIQYYENIIGCMPGNVYWINKDCIAVGCNRNVLNMFGFQSIDEFRGLNFEQMGKIGGWSAEAQAKFEKDTRQVIETGEPKLHEEEPPIPTASGEMIYFLTSRVPLYDHHRNLLGVVGISMDVTKLKLMEEFLRQSKIQAESANIAKTEFLENMRHDIRTPLTGIIGAAEIIQLKSKNTEVQEFADYLMKSSEALMHYLNAILESIQVTSGAVPVLQQKFDLKTKLQEVVDLMLAKAGSKNLSLQFLYDPALPNFVMSDPKRLHRIALEVISNAIMFTQEGFVKLSVSAEQHKENHFILRLTVEDSGIGIPPERQAEIFTRFKKLTPSYKGIYKGLGLGLHIVKEYVDDLDGEIYLENVHPHGTRFTCLIPMKISLLQTKEGSIFP